MAMSPEERTWVMQQMGIIVQPAYPPGPGTLPTAPDATPQGWNNLESQSTYTMETQSQGEEGEGLSDVAPLEQTETDL